jgi:glycosyltransferase involved in cell wall biosynthesis
MRILYLASLVDVPEMGQAGNGGIRHTVDVAEHLRERQHDVTVFCGGRASGTTTFQVNGVSYVRWYRGVVGSRYGYSDINNSTLLNRTIGWARRQVGPSLRKIDSVLDARAMVAYIKENPADVIYERTTSYSSAGARIARRSGIPFVAELNDLDQSKFVLDTADAIVIPEPKSLPERYRSKAIKNPWGVRMPAEEPDLTSELPKNVPGNNTRPKVVMVSSFLDWHGTHQLIDAAAILTTRGMKIDYILIGDGPQRNPSQESVNRLGLSQWFTFNGMMTQSEIASVLSTADIAVAPYADLLAQNPGRAEMATPLKILEYMASAVPTLVSAPGNLSGIVEHEKTGWTYEPNDAEGLAAAIARAIDDPQQATALGQAGKQKVLNEFTWGRHVDRLCLLFENLISG